MTLRTAVTLILTTTFCLGTAGCGESYKVVPVSGKITVDGQPLANASVYFQPTGDKAAGVPASMALTDAQGNYTLTTATEKPQEGAVPGSHKVILSAVSQDPQGGEVPTESSSLPEKAAKADLSFDVPPEGTDQANFDL